MDTAVLLDEAESNLRTDPQRAIDITNTLSANGALAPGDQARLKLISSRAHIHIGRFDTGELIAQETVELCKRESLPRELGLAHMELGIYRFVNMDFDEALRQYEHAERLLSEAGYRTDLARVYINVANVYNRQSEFHNAISLYERALTIARESNDELTQAKVLTNLSGLYQYVLFDDDSSVQYTDMAITLYERLGDPIGKAKCLFNKASFLKQKGRVEDALILFRQSLWLRLKFSEPDDLAMTYNGIINCLVQTGKLDEARSVLEKDFFEFQKSSDLQSTLMYYKYSKANVLFAFGEYDEAHRLASVAQWFFHNNEVDEIAINIIELKSNILLESGKFEEAAYALKEFHDAKKQSTRNKAEARLVALRGTLENSLAQKEAELERVKNVELAQAVKHLEELHRENDEYVALLAHELRSPLHTMKAVCSLIANSKALSQEELTSLEHEMHSMVTRMLDLIAQVLDRTKQRYNTHEGIVNAHTVWEHVLSVSERAAQQKQITLSWKFESNSLHVKASDRDLLTIIDNLISNAVKYSMVGSYIDVSVKIGHDDIHRRSVVLCVKDNGQGFSESDLKRLFRPFETLTSKPTANEPSSGIGLHLVKRAVDRCGGQIWCESEQGHGATFFVRLPLAE